MTSDANNLRQHLLRSVSGSFAIKLGVMLLRIAITVTFARVLGVEGFGAYAFFMSLGQLLTLPAKLGGDQLTVREVAAYSATAQWAKIKGLITRLRQASLLMSGVLISGGLAWGLFWYDRQGNPDQALLFWITLAMVPLQALLALQSATLRGLRHILLGQLAQDFLRSLVVLVLVFPSALYLGDRKLDPSWALGAQLFSAAAMLVIFRFILAKRLPPELKTVAPAHETSRWFKSLIPFMVSGAMLILYREVSIVLLGLLSTPEEIGLFRVAQRGAGLILFSQLALNTTLGPTIARLHAGGEKTRLQTILSKTTALVTLVGLGAVLILAGFGKPILGLAFGDAYVHAYPILIILGTGQLLNLALGSPDVVLDMTRLEKYTAKGVVVAALLSLVLNLCLIPGFGAMGAAAATAASLVLWKGLLLFWLKRETGINSMALAHLFPSPNPKADSKKNENRPDHTR